MNELSIEYADLRPRSWADAFPWIPSKAATEDWELGAWWEQPIDDADVVSHKAITDSIVALAIDRLSKWPIGDVLPGLPGDLELARLNLPVRASNVLSREKIFTGAGIAEISVGSLFAFRNAGVGTVTSVLCALVSHSTAPLQATLAEVASTDEVDPIGVASPWVGELVQDMEILASWYFSLGCSGRGILAELPLGSPKSAVEARKRLLALSANDVAPASSVNVAEKLDRALLGLDERYREILAKRLFAWMPRTLEEIGIEFGVTRERVRQLEVKARARLNNVVTGDNDIGHVASLMRNRIRRVLPLDELLAEVPALAAEVATVSQPAWRIIDVLDDAYEIVDGWCVEPSLEAARRDTAVILEEFSDAYGVVRLADADQSFGDAGAPHWLTAWLTYLGYEFREGFVLLKTASLSDMAAAMLSISGAPLGFDELHKQVGRGTPGSLRNQVSTEPSITKIDREHFGLVEWGLDGYTNIRGEIAKLLDRADGELPLALVVQSLVERFGVSPSSVSVYAGSAPFQVMNGIVRRSTGQLAGSGKNPAKVQGYYRRGDDWLYRTTVTFDHIRGSGWPASTALSTILKMAPGEYAELPSRLGNQKFSYKNHQPSFGSIKRFLEEMDLSVGDEIFLVFSSDGTFDIEQLPDTPSDRISQALRFVGADIFLGMEDAIDALGSAIKFPSDADAESIAEGYKARKELPIHDLILGIEPEKQA